MVYWAFNVFQVKKIVVLALKIIDLFLYDFVILLSTGPVLLVSMSLVIVSGGVVGTNLKSPAVWAGPQEGDTPTRHMQYCTMTVLCYSVRP